MNGTHWSEGLFMSLDFETTGVDNTTARAVSAALVIDSPTGTGMSLTGIINPGVEVPDEAAEVHGLTTAVVQEQGRDSHASFLAIHKWLRAGAIMGMPLVIYNAAYDWPLFLHEMKRHDIQVDPVVYTFRILDPLVIDRAVDRYRKGKRKLELVAQAYRVQLLDAHDSMADAVAAAKIMRAICKKYPNVKNKSLEELQVLQGRWHKDWASRMNEYFRNNNIEMEIPDVPWPGVSDELRC